MHEIVNVFSCRTVDGDMLLEVDTLSEALNYFNDNDICAYVESEDYDVNNQSVIDSCKILSKNYFDVLKQKYDMDDFTGYIGEFFDDDLTYEERVKSIKNFLFDLYDIAIKLQ